MIERERERKERESMEKEREKEMAREEEERKREREKDRLTMENTEKEEMNSRGGGGEGFEKRRSKGEEEKKDREGERNEQNERIGAERAAVECVMAEARKRAFEKAKKAYAKEQERHKPSNGVSYQAKALAEKNRRDIMAQTKQLEKDTIAEHLDAEVKRWSSGKEGNLPTLLSTLQYRKKFVSPFTPTKISDDLPKNLQNLRLQVRWTRAALSNEIIYLGQDRLITDDSNFMFSRTMWKVGSWVILFLCSMGFIWKNIADRASNGKKTYFFNS